MPNKKSSIQWTGHNYGEIFQFTGRKNHSYFKNSLIIYTPEGYNGVTIGDYIIKDSDGKFHVSKSKD